MFDPVLAAVDSVSLPGILRHKQEAWDAGKEVMMFSYEGMTQAIETDDNEAMLSHTEAFHLGYEQLVRMIRPLVPELSRFTRNSTSSFIITVRQTTTNGWAKRSPP